LAFQRLERRLNMGRVYLAALQIQLSRSFEPFGFKGQQLAPRQSLFLDTLAIFQALG
jgi:hypothetical protein